MKLLWLLLLVSPLWGQSTTKSLSLDDFSGGLNTWQSSLLIQDNQTPNAQNVLFDETGGVTRREGFRALNATAIGDGSTAANSTYQLETANGNRYCVAFSSTNGYSSTDVCQTFTSFVSTLTRLNDVNCDSYQDRLYCVNNQYNFYFDGTNDVPVSAMPANLEGIKVHRNRCFAFGNSTTPSRFFYSNLGDCTAWTTSTDYIEISPEDGDIITGIGPPIFDMLPIYKKFSTWALRGSDPDTWVLVNISKEIGAKNHRSIDNFKQLQLFDSLGPNGGQPGIYAFNGIVIEEASKNLRNEIDLIDTFRSATNRKLIDTKADFDAGTYDSLAMSSSRENGMMQSSYTTFTDTLNADFNQGTTVNISTWNPLNALTILVSTTGFTNAGFETGATTGWTTSGFGSWTVKTDSSMYGSYLVQGPCISLAGVEASYWGGVAICAGDGSGCIYNNHVTGTTVEYTANILTGAATSYYVSVYSNSSTEGASYLDSITFTKSRNVMFKGNFATNGCSGTKKAMQFDMEFTSDRLDPSANYTSRIFDMAISTPIWGLMQATVSSGTAGATATFEVQSSTASDGGGFETLVSETLGTEISAAQRRYLRYKISMTSGTTQNPTVNDATVSGASTGTWLSPELFLSNNISAGGWGLFTVEQTVTGSEASMAYAIRASTYSGGTTNASWTTQTANTAITISTGAYFQIRSTHTIGVATETAKLDSIVINWNEGSQTTSPTGKVFRGRYHYGAQSLGGTRNDVMYVLDSNLAWTKFTGVQPRHLNVVGQKFIMSGSTTSTAGFVHEFYTTDADDGEAINAIYDTKELSLGALQNTKALDRLFLVHSSFDTSLTAQLRADGGLRTQSYTLNLSTGAAFGIRQRKVEPPLNGNTFRIRLSNNAASKPWEILGIGLFFRDLGLMQP